MPHIATLENVKDLSYDVSPFVGDGDGAVDAAAEADIVEGVDQLREDEDVEVAALRHRPGPHCGLGWWKYFRIL